MKNSWVTADRIEKLLVNNLIFQTDWAQEKIRSSYDRAKEFFDEKLKRSKSEEEINEKED